MFRSPFGRRSRSGTSYTSTSSHARYLGVGVSRGASRGALPDLDAVEDEDAREDANGSIDRAPTFPNGSLARARVFSLDRGDRRIVAFARASIDDDVDVDATRARDDTDVSPRMSHRSLALERDVRRLARVDDDASRYPET